MANFEYVHPKKTRVMDEKISVIIPNRNKENSIGLCLEALFSLPGNCHEVIVVDDCSEDRSVEIIQHYPCTLIRLPRHHGASP